MNRLERIVSGLKEEFEKLHKIEYIFIVLEVDITTLMGK